MEVVMTVLSSNCPVATGFLSMITMKVFSREGRQKDVDF